MAKVTKKSKDTVVEMDIPTSSTDAQEKPKPVMPIKTKAAYKLYPPSILYGKGAKTNKRGKRGSTQKTSTKKESGDVAPPVAKKAKESPVAEEPTVMEEKPAEEKPAEEKPAAEAVVAAAEAAVAAAEAPAVEAAAPAVEATTPAVEEAAVPEEAAVKPTEEEPTGVEAVATTTAPVETDSQ